MDARLLRHVFILCLTHASAVFFPACVWGEGVYETANFVVHAPTQDMARQIAEAAEDYRHELAILWLGEPLPGNWSSKCPIRARVGQMGAGGATNFKFAGGEVFGWNMTIQGSLERILDSVLPHEVTHTILACHFRRPLPRWADEGAATLVEHESERRRQVMMLNEMVRSPQRIPLRELLAMMEYPSDDHQVLMLYAEGYSLAEFLVQQKGDQEGRAIYLSFIATALERGWETAFRHHYSFDSVQDVERQWMDWVLAGSPRLNSDQVRGLANATPPPADESSQVVIAGQSPDLVPGLEVQAAQPPSTAAVAALAETSRSLAPLPATSRPLRSAPVGLRLDAPEPAYTALPPGPVPTGHSILSAGDGSTNTQYSAMPRPASRDVLLDRAVTPDRSLQSAGSGGLDWSDFPEAGGTRRN